MNSRKRDLEIVYNLLWKNRPMNADDRSNIVGMYDIPSTTLTWDHFKSYLLKNSGSSCVDVKVSYIDTDDKEVSIESSTDFQLAMYSFRKRARVGDIITLKLDKICSNKKKKEFAATKYWTETEQPIVAEETHIAEADVPPDWFLKYMKKFKRDLLEDVSTIIAKNTSRMSVSNQPAAARKAKVESQKKSRKLAMPTPSGTYTTYDELKKFAKFERKLEKLEQKSIKLNSKKMALKLSSEGDVDRPTHKNRLIGLAPSETELLMNAMPMDSHVSTIPHMLGGETFLQQWKVVNTGALAWSNDTELRFAWGSESLNPVEKRASCPHLLPGEDGVVSVLIDIPVSPGNYECYWHFHHEGIRFGHWLGCQVIVDEQPFRMNSMPKSCNNSITPEKERIVNDDLHHKADVQNNTDVIVNQDEITARPFCNEGEMHVSLERKKIKLNDVAQPEDADLIVKINNLVLDSKSLQVNDISTSVIPVSNTMQNVNNLDGDNISMLSLSGNSSDTTTSNDGYVMISKDTNKCTKDDEHNESLATAENKVDNLSLECSFSDTQQQPINDNENTEPDQEVNIDDNFMPEYAYIYYNGEKYPFHKKYLSEEYFQTAEKVPIDAANVVVPVATPTTSECEKDKKAMPKSRCTSECSSSRLFVFPQHSPGFEVVYPQDSKDQVDSFVPSDSCYDYQNDSGCPNDSGYDQHPINNDALSGSMNSISVNAGSQPYNPFPIQDYSCCNDPPVYYYDSHDFTHSFCGKQDYQSPPHQCEYFNPPPRPCSSQDHSYVGYRQATPSSPPKSTMSTSVGSSTPTHAQPSATTEVVTSTNYTNPETARSFHSGNGHRHLHRPHVWNARPDNLITGAAILASSAMSTARNMVNMVIQNGTGRWVNGHWVTENPNTKRENGLRLLAEMGFIDRDLNATLMARYNDDVHRVISELVQ